MKIRQIYDSLHALFQANKQDVKSEQGGKWGEMLQLSLRRLPTKLTITLAQPFDSARIGIAYLSGMKPLK